MAKPFRSLWEQMSPDAQAAAEQKMQAMLAAMPLQELQQARHRAHAHLTTMGQGTPARLARSNAGRICTSARCAASSRPWAAPWRSRRSFQRGS